MDCRVKPGNDDLTAGQARQWRPPVRRPAI